MAKHNKTGTEGEALAASWLIKNNYEILHTNWRFKHWEIDIIAKKEEKLHFVEVKTRTSKQFGFPEESISKRKLQFLVNAAEEFCFRNPGWLRIQFDVIAINLTAGEEPSYFLIEDVYDF